MTERQESLSEKPFTGKSYGQVAEIQERYCEALEKAGKFGTEVNSIGIHTVYNKDSRQYGIGVGFAVELTAEKIETLPKEFEGIPLTYRFVGRIDAQENKPRNIFKRLRKNS